MCHLRKTTYNLRLRTLASLGRVGLHAELRKSHWYRREFFRYLKSIHGESFRFVLGDPKGEMRTSKVRSGEPGFSQVYENISNRQAPK
jgi:hypothetical protein